MSAYRYPTYETVRFTRPDGTSWVWNLDTDRIQAAIQQHADCGVECVECVDALVGENFDRAARAAIASGPELEWREVLPVAQFGTLDDAQRSY